MAVDAIGQPRIGEAARQVRKGRRVDLEGVDPAAKPGVRGDQQREIAPIGANVIDRAEQRDEALQQRRDLGLVDAAGAQHAVIFDEGRIRAIHRHRSAAGMASDGEAERRRRAPSQHPVPKEEQPAHRLEAQPAEAARLAVRRGEETRQGSGDLDRCDRRCRGGAGPASRKIRGTVPGRCRRTVGLAESHRKLPAQTLRSI